MTTHLLIVLDGVARTSAITSASNVNHDQEGSRFAGTQEFTDIAPPLAAQEIGKN